MTPPRGHGRGPYKVLLTGAGTLIARGVHDALHGRSDHIEFVGANLDPRDPTALLCARVHPLPSDDDPVLLAHAITDIVDQERPDLVVVCRDPHIEVVAGLQDSGLLRSKSPLGPASLAKLMVDKWAAYQWCEEQGLPFTPTVLTDEPDSDVAIRALLDEYGFPLITKPRDGSGSLGVRLLHNHDQVGMAGEETGMVIQPFLDAPAGAVLELDSSKGTPLFWEIPVPRNYGAQILIGPEGEIGPILPMAASQRLGRNESCSPWSDAGLDDLLTTITARFAEAGWRGPLTVQARPHSETWFITEFGGRFSGGTSQRTWLGVDEVGWIINSWAGWEVVPPLTQPPADDVHRYLTDCPVWFTPEGPSLTPRARQ